MPLRLYINVMVSETNIGGCIKLGQLKAQLIIHTCTHFITSQIRSYWITTVPQTTNQMFCTFALFWLYLNN